MKEESMTPAQLAYYDLCTAQRRLAEALPRSQESDALITDLGMALEEVYAVLRRSTVMTATEHEAFISAHLYGQEEQTV